ncbi:MAG TPA: YeaH/YhbH family protein [Burkholderiaceae bacterium]|nr:YeaH/YhbH family protein [Burkholderiaceae bacterium]
MNEPSAPTRFMRIVDRRGDPPGRGAVNRERFIRRFKEEIKRAVDAEVGKRGVADMGKGGKVSIPGRGLTEPRLRHDDGTGSRDFVLPGNREFVPGDAIPRPDGGGDAQGNQPGSGESRDDFSFVLSRDEFLQLFFDDLELPNLERTHFGDVPLERRRRAGLSRDGVPSNLSAQATVRMSIARRIALRGGLAERIEALMTELERSDGEHRIELSDEIARLVARRARLAFLEDIDLRYRAHHPVPAPATRAVMLCLMDVSGSMDERKKDLAKRFFALLYLFLERKYGAVEVVFIRHTESAQEVDENTFFHDPQSGGTRVMPALELARQIIDTRYAGAEWNTYIAQASDGDCGSEDATLCAGYVRGELLPRTRYFAYVDIPSDQGGWFARPSDLWQCYEAIAADSFAKRRLTQRGDIWPVFRELFARREAHA